MLDAGKLSLSVIGLLKEHLTADNAVELFVGVSGSSARKAKEWLAARFPRPDVPEVIRRVPAKPQPSPPLSTDKQALSTCQDEVRDVPVSQKDPVLSTTALPQSHPKAVVEPLSVDRFVVRFTVSRGTREKLERARNLARHRRPDGNLEALFDDALDALLRELEKAKFRTTTRPAAKRTTRGTMIGSATRREVVQRDGARCTFVGPDGRRCDSEAFLEFDHIEPAGLGGNGEAGNVRLRCRAHNQLAAEQVYGRDRMERSRRRTKERKENREWASQK